MQLNRNVTPFLNFKDKEQFKASNVPTSKLAMNLSGDAEETTMILFFQTYSNSTDTLPYTSTQFPPIEDENNDSSQTLSLIVQSSAAFIGFIGNGVTFVVLKRSTSISSGTSLRLLQNQTVVDAIVCFIGSIFVLQPPCGRQE